MNDVYPPKMEVSGLWIGDTLPPLAELCIRSYLANGIDFRLFTYRDYDNIPDGTIVHNASEIISENLVFRHDNGSLAPFADWFRNVWLEKEGGFWTDLDMVCLAPDLPEQLPWFAEQEPGLVAVGIIGFPPQHPLMTCFRELSEDPASPMPWDDDGRLACKRQFKIDTPDPAMRRRRAMWGNAGPEGFTEALAHFKLLDMAAPSSSIYPLHYTVWRNCYNGLVNLSSPELKGSWGIHLWGELLRREPDAFDNVAKESLVGQLLDMYMPQSPKPASFAKKEKTSILVGVCTCVSAEKRRNAIRNTWMKRNVEGVKCLFFLGRKDAIPGESDTVSLWVNDDYNHLPEKVLAFFRYALENYDFDWLFKCDDDTYIDLERLTELPDDRYDLIGDPSLEARGAASGGAGYFLSRELLEKIVAFPNIPSTGAEDLIFADIATRLGAKCLATNRLNMNPSPYPMKDNNMVTAHWCPPEQMSAIENFHTAFPFTVYYGKHKHWADSLLFYRDGTFRRKTSGCAGRYIFNGSKGLTLKWFSWAPESMIRNGDGYSNSDLTLSRPVDQPDLFSLLSSEWENPGSDKAESGLVLIQMGSGTNMIPGWINLDLPKYDITRPLPWEDECVDSFFLEHVIEHVLPSEAYEFFLETWRTLKPGGVLRLAFPDLLRIAKHSTPEYIQFLKLRNWGDGSPASSLRNIIQNHGHKAIWTTETMKSVLESIGYEVVICPLGESSHAHLKNLEMHGFQLGHAFNDLETSCLEATKSLNN